MNIVASTLSSIISDMYALTVVPELTRPEERFGDFATNVAMQLGGRLQRKPREIADELAVALQGRLADTVSEITVAGPGFINIRLSDAALGATAMQAPSLKPKRYEGQIVVAEYSDPNPFKILHAGHLYTSIVGYAVANLAEVAGATVHRVNFGGDVGLHVGKTMWAMIKELGGEFPEKLLTIPEHERSAFMAACYVAGTNAYEDNEAAQDEIQTINKAIYAIQANDEHTTPLAKMYWMCRTWSYEVFDAFYARIGTPFEKYYPESITAPIGVQTITEHMGPGMYEDSDGAIVFKGEPYKLHTRVFINSQGIPTYEAKDVGLLMLKKQEYNFDQSIVITGNEQEQYMAVVLKSIEQFAPELVHATTHLTHGILKMKGGVKMSSRKGNILRADDVLDAVALASRTVTGHEDMGAVLGAVKYAFLKHRIGPDIIYDPEESVSLEGNSGPYLQYAHARARSILAKVGKAAPVISSLESGERSLTRKLCEYPEVLERAVDELMPHYVCTYLYELAQTFNRFYEHNRVVGDEREAVRTLLVTLYADILQDGLSILGIAAPERM